MIRVRSIHKIFSGDKPVLYDVDAVFQPSTMTLIIGNSGTGKTTLMKCMVGLVEPDKGAVFFNEQNFTTMSYEERKKIRKEIGMLFQNGALFDSMTVQENILFPLELNSQSLSLKQKIHRVDECLERVGLSKTNHLYPAELSGGMKKRVGIARAIVLNPQYLFVDEPNSGLDPQNALLIDQLIRNLTEELEITTVVITHDMNSVFELGGYVYFMHNGGINWEGKSEDIFKTSNQVLNKFLFTRKTFQLLKKNANLLESHMKNE